MNRKNLIYKHFSNAFVVYRSKLHHKFDLKKATLINIESNIIRRKMIGNDAIESYQNVNICATFFFLISPSLKYYIFSKRTYLTIKCLKN